MIYAQPTLFNSSTPCAIKPRINFLCRVRKVLSDDTSTSQQSDTFSAFYRIFQGTTGTENIEIVIDGRTPVDVRAPVRNSGRSDASVGFVQPFCLGSSLMLNNWIGKFPVSKPRYRCWAFWYECCECWTMAHLFMSTRFQPPIFWGLTDIFPARKTFSTASQKYKTCIVHI